jgi:K(+)-stimulated pyrophosphate-energized sodium pump
MILPGLYAILSPLATGFLIGPKCLTGLLVGSITSGMMLAIMMANAGGAWDNAKKFIEIEGAAGGKVGYVSNHILIHNRFNIPP